MSSRDVEITGFTTSIREYSRVEGIILRPAEAIVKYGTLVLIRDNTQGREYLGMITRVEEETPHPALDVERLRRLYQTVSETAYADANRVLMELLSPTHKLIKWSSIMRVELRVLGEIVDAPGGGRRLSTYDRPPRPFSSITQPDPAELEEVIHHSLGREYARRGLYIGRLSLLETVRVYMNPERLNTHLSILAQTGGGKTETVKRLVFEVSRRRGLIRKPEGGIIVFDIAGEYTGYPFLREDTVPLLDAVLDPEEYAADLSPGEMHRPERVTIVVPYEATRIGWREQERLIMKGLESLACSLADRLRRKVSVLAFFTFERRQLVVVPGCRVEASRKPRYYEAYRAIGEEPFLIVGLPLPGFMDIETMIELSGTRSEYFPLIVADIAGALDLYHGNDIYSVGLLLAILESLTGRTPLRTLLERDNQGNIKLLSLYEERCKTKSWEVTGRERFKISKRFFYAFLRYLAWLSYRWGIADPKEHSETEALCRLLSDPEHRKRLSEMLEDLRQLVTAGEEFTKTTLASSRNALRKLESMTSDMVDTILFDRLMERLMTGFTIVHLAPPSTGGVDQLLGLLVKRLFNLHVGNYSPRRLTVLVVEEAHNLAPAGEERASKRSLLRVAREGRKWGLSLWLVTQRPSFVDASLLSQTATSILLRTTNPEDLSTIKRSVESAAAEIVDRLPELEPTRGEALLTGLAAPERRIPLLILVEKLEKKSM